MSLTQPNGIKVRGFNQTIRALRELGAPDAEIKAAGLDAAQQVADEAKSLAPVRSGRLRDSIRVSAQLRRIKVQAGNNRMSRTGIPYANPIHWGWFKRNILPQPFFSRALRITREDVYKTYYANIAKLIAKQNAKGKSTQE